MDMEKMLKKIAKLEYHQSLLLQMLENSEKDFYKLVIKHSLSEEDVNQLYQLCDQLTIELEEQKAEGFVNFQSLYDFFKQSLHPRLNEVEVIKSCLSQNLFVDLMNELKKYIK